MLKLLIIDNQKEARDNIKLLLEDYCPSISIIEMASGVAEGIDAIQEFEPDIVLLDIEMDDGSGFELLHSIPELTFQVIFVTAYDSHAIKAVKYSPIDYLLKPIDPKELIKAIDKAKTMLKLSRNNSHFYREAIQQEFASKITIPTQSGYEFLKVEEIIAVLADGNYSVFHLINGGRIITAVTLKQINDILPEKIFYRTHRSSIVNIRFVSKFLSRNGGVVVLENDMEVSLARRKKEEFLKVMRFIE